MKVYQVHVYGISYKFSCAFILLCFCRHFEQCFLIFIVVPWLYLGNSQVSVYRTIGPTLVLVITRSMYKNRVMTKPVFGISDCKNKGADQLWDCHAADLCLCFRIHVHVYAKIRFSHDAAHFVYLQMTDGELCLLCQANNKRSYLHSYQLNLDEAIVLCENPQVRSIVAYCKIPKVWNSRLEKLMGCTVPPRIAAH